jgi:WD40 repeat protein
MAFAGDSTLLAIGGWTGTISVWDVREAAHPVRLSVFPGSGEVLGFLSDGSTLITKDPLDQVSVWDLREPASPERISTLPETMEAAIVRGNLLVAWNLESPLTLWDLTDPADPVQASSLPGPGGMYDVSPDGNLLVERNNDELVIWNIQEPASPGPLYSLPAPDGVSDLSLSAEGLAVAGCVEYVTVRHNIDIFVAESGEETRCARASITVWELGDPTEPIILAGHTEGIDLIAFEPGGSSLLSKSETSVIFWNIRDPRSPFELARLSANDGDGITSLVFSPDNRMLAVGSNSVQLWNVQDPGNPSGPVVLNAAGQWVTDLAFSQDGSLLVGAYEDSITVWDVQVGEALDRRCEVPADTIIRTMSLGRYENLDLVAIGDIQGVTHFCYLADAAEAELPHPLITGQDQITALAFSQSDTTLLVSGSDDGSLILWDVRTGEAVVELLAAGENGSVTGIASDADSQLLAARTMDNTIFLWDMSDPGAPEFLGSAIASPDSINDDREKVALSSQHLLATGGGSDGIMIWDASNPARPVPLITLASQNEEQDSEPVAFSQNGGLLATGYTNGTVILWDMDPASWSQRTCQRAGRNLTSTEREDYLSAELKDKTCSQWPLEPQLASPPGSIP